MSTAWEALFFDVDGVLIDSMDVKGEAFADAFPEVPHLRQEILEYHLAHGGVNRAKKLADLHVLAFGRAATHVEVAERLRAFAEHIEDRVVDAPEMPGTRAALDHWSGVIPLHAVSATPDEELRRILDRRGLLEYFNSASGWPPEKSDLIASIVSSDDLIPSRCILVGDARQDHEAAERNGLHFIQMARTPADAFVELNLVITDLRDLAVVLSTDPD